MGRVLAFDLGASSGRAFTGSLASGRLALDEIHRFSNDPVRVQQHLHWDILRLLHEIIQGLQKAGQSGYDEPLQSMAIDSWAVDFGLVAPGGELLGNPFHYRDAQTTGIMDEVFQLVPRAEIFRRTGIQFMPINTIYQLYAMKKRNSPLLAQAQTLLMIPDLLRYFLTGEQISEFTNASTTQLFNPFTHSWDSDLLRQLGLPEAIFAPLVDPGSSGGTLLPSVCDEAGITPLPVIIVGEHDTASAVAAVPAESKDFAYLSSGTWSLMGTEVDQPVITPQSLDWNFTNEGGIGRTYRFLKNIMGLWLVQECRRAWERGGKHYSYSDMVALANQAEPFHSLIDPDHSMFLNPPNMPAQIQEYCRSTGQPVPETDGALLRCIEESLALKYRMVLERIEVLAQKRFQGLHIVGGGIQNQSLCQYTANAIARPVWAGPAEASATGNILVQYLASGDLGTIWDARAVVRNSFPIKTYEPRETDRWDSIYERFKQLPFE